MKMTAKFSAKDSLHAQMEQMEGGQNANAIICQEVYVTNYFLQVREKLYFFLVHRIY